MSCIERCFHFSGNFLLRKHIWDTAKPLNAGVALRELLGRPDNEKVEQTVQLPEWPLGSYWGGLTMRR